MGQCIVVWVALLRLLLLVNVRQTHLLGHSNVCELQEPFEIVTATAAAAASALRGSHAAEGHNKHVCAHRAIV